MSLSVPSWEVPFRFSDPCGTLELNTTVTLPSSATGIYLLVPDTCKASVPLRVTDDDVPQGDGGELHKRFYQPYFMRLAIQLWETVEQPACNELLTEMCDVLGKHIRAFTNADDARVYWTPDGAAERMIKRARLSDHADVTIGSTGAKQVEFEVASPYPYAWDATEITDSLASGVQETLTNDGSADFWPVLKVYGSSSSFTIVNDSVLDEDGNPLQIVYSGTAIPGSGQYVEIDTFKNTMFLNGDGANYMAGINPLTTDFFPLAVGDNDITITGATMDVLWQNAWA